MTDSDTAQQATPVDPAPSTEGPSEVRASRVGHLSRVRRWCAVFGPVQDQEIEGFDLVVVGATGPGGAGALRPGQVRGLQERTILVVGHVVAGTGGGTPGDRPPSVSLVQALEQVGAWALLGVDGVYLDDLEPVAGAGLDALLRAVQEQHPDLLVLAQSGPVRAGQAGVDLVGLPRPLLDGAPTADAAAADERPHGRGPQRPPAHLKGRKSRPWS